MYARPYLFFIISIQKAFDAPKTEFLLSFSFRLHLCYYKSFGKSSPALQESGIGLQRPNPRSQSQIMGGLRLLHWNARGHAGKATYLKHLLRSQDIDVALVSETFLAATTRFRLPGYEVYRQYHTKPPDHRRAIPRELMRAEDPDAA
ncbi:unnamed protein product [Pieris brassicae]|uniref:Endonuclease/exonuclease/phosphatase domain-containing protein n=1 Tax=Pieris brassicae TaxID=7116 RepID=A0A9P0TST4_PIEBR|nr:unnamed protein product [Pieris brassicae]